METNEIPYQRTLVFSAAIRIFHWLRVFSIVTLALTGFYISWPFLVAAVSSDVLIQGWIRFAHLIAGFLLCAITVARFYLFFFGKSDIERRSFKDLVRVKSWLTQLKSYVWVGHLDKTGAYGPLQLVVYMAINFVALFMAISGLVMYANVYHEGLGGLLWGSANWITAQMGGLAVVRLWHHYLAWAFIIFVVVHIYMVVWSSIRFKHHSVDVIVSGYDYQPVKAPDNKN